MWLGGGAAHLLAPRPQSMKSDSLFLRGPCLHGPPCGQLCARKTGRGYRDQKQLSGEITLCDSACLPRGHVRTPLAED